MISFKTLAGLAGLLVLCCCTPSNQNEFNTKKVPSRQDTLAALEMMRFNREVNAPQAIGLRGVFHVPEMLSVVVLDSAPVELLAQKRVEAFTKIENDIKRIGAQVDGSPGSIYYSNDPENFKFECIMLIREMPKINPLNSKIVVLEAASMVVYNHSGTYRTLNQAYAKTKAYCDSSGLEQIGPMREFYIVSPINTSDTNAWLTRILVPVSKR